MYKLYQKNEFAFALLWIGIYCVIMTPLRDKFGDESIFVVLVLASMATTIRLWIQKHDLKEKYGLQGFPRDIKRYLYFIPMWVLATGNLWGGYDLLHIGFAQVLATLSMILFAYIEEVIFRGLLLKAMLPKSGVRKSIIIVSLTFGIGHILNLFTGQAGLETVIQIIFAIAWGFIFTIVFYKSKSLLPCIITHAFINASSQFAVENTKMDWLFIVLTIVTAVLYCSYLLSLKDQKSYSMKQEMKE